MGEYIWMNLANDNFNLLVQTLGYEDRKWVGEWDPTAVLKAIGRAERHIAAVGITEFTRSSSEEVGETGPTIANCGVEGYQMRGYLARLERLAVWCIKNDTTIQYHLDRRV
jgi:hypothetical protein